MAEALEKESFFRRFMGKIFDIRQGEWLIFALMSLYIFFTIYSYLILKTASRALFLHRVGSEYLPYVYIMVAVIAGVIASIYGGFSKKFSVYKLILVTDFIIILNLVAFWYLFGITGKAAWLFYTFYIWVSIFGVLVPSQYWLFANHVYNPREARRIFGLLAGMAIAGGTTAGYFIKFAVHAIGTENLLTVCIGIQALLGLLLFLIQQKAAIAGKKKSREDDHRVEKKKDSFLQIFRELMAVKHLRLLMAIIATTVIAVQFVDFQFNTIASQTFQGDDLTAFLGFWNSNLSVISLLIQFFLAQRLLRRFGVTVAVCALPLGLALGNLGLLLYPAIYTAIILKVSDGAFRYSLNKSGMELLYLPIPTALKDRTKTFIDMVVDRTGRGISGILLLLATAVLGLSVSQISIMALVIIGLWLFLIFRIRVEYVNTFRASLARRSLDPDELRIRLDDSSHVDLLLPALDGQNIPQTVFALSLLSDAAKVELSPYFEQLIAHPSSRVRCKVFQVATARKDPVLLKRLKTYLDREEDRDVYLDGLTYYTRLQPEDSLDYLAGQLKKPENHRRLWTAQFLALDREKFLTMVDVETVKKCLQSGSVENRLAGAILLKVIEDIPLIKEFKNRLLSDPSHKVQRAFIRALGVSSRREFLPQLFLALTDKRLKSAALEALSTYGERIYGTLADYLLDPRENILLRRAIPKLLATIGRQNAVDILMQALDVEEEMLRFQVLKSLNRLRSRSQDLILDKSRIDKQLEKEAVYYFRLFVAEKQIAQDSELSGDTLLSRAFTERREHSLEILFRTLGLTHNAEDMLFAYQGIVSGDKLRKASALEFLDNILERKTKTLVFGIIDDIPDERKMQYARSLPGFKPGDLSGNLEHVLNGRDTWLKTCVLYFSGRYGRPGMDKTAKRLAGAKERMVRESAEFYLQSLRST